ncbi:MAG: glycosyltransferase [Anaerolineae bacterium]
MSSAPSFGPIAPYAGIIIPTYFSSKPSNDTVRELIWLTVRDCPHYVSPDATWLVVDGDDRTATLAAETNERFAESYGRPYRLLVLPENGGKLWALREGLRRLLSQRDNLRYAIIRDGDGDHLPAHIPALVAAAESLERFYGHTRLIVIGSRGSRHHPMGWVRGELETLLDQVTLDAVIWTLARQGRTPDLQHCRGADPPDLSSGYKLYGRAEAERLATDDPIFSTLSESDYWHYGPETCTIVEAFLRDTIVAQVPRLTWEQQPTTAFGEFHHTELYGELLLWVYTRLEIPVGVAARMYDHRTSPLHLRTTPEGRKALDGLRVRVMERLASHLGHGHVAPPGNDVLSFL